MQRKTINKIIKSKVNAWLDTITDKKLIEQLKDDIIITGGCIASLLLKEQVNDFDIYLRTKDSVNKLLQYYLTKDICEKHSIEIFDGINKENYIGAFEESYKNNIEYIYNARAISLRTLKSDQVKLFFNGQTGIRFDKVEDKPFSLAYLSPNAISFTDDLQVIIRFYGEAEEIHKNYDFVHALNYWTFKTGLVLLPESLECLLTKQLKYQGSLYPLTSILRIKKFTKRGWNISAGETLKIMYQLSKLDLSNVDILEEQLVGMDVAYFGILISSLQSLQKDGKITNETSFFNLIDAIFNNDLDSEE